MADEFPNMENDHGDLGEVSWYLSLMGKISDFSFGRSKPPGWKPTSEVPAGSVLGCVCGKKSKWRNRPKREMDINEQSISIISRTQKHFEQHPEKSGWRHSKHDQTGIGRKGLRTAKHCHSTVDSRLCNEVCQNAVNSAAGGEGFAVIACNDRRFG